MFRDPELRTNCGYHWKNNIDDKVDDTIPLKPITRKETLPSRTLHNFMVQLEKTTRKLLDAIRKVRDKLQLDLNS
uniref:Putative ovule protein n=1 Tax=Solanum chacoense TaxID=4108 RepID=A0A0V0GFE3_SOLCH